MQPVLSSSMIRYFWVTENISSFILLAIISKFIYGQVHLVERMAYADCVKTGEDITDIFPGCKKMFYEIQNHILQLLIDMD